MSIPPVDSDASHVAVAMAAQRIAAYCDQRNITVNQALCEELAEMVIDDYRAFIAGVRFGRTHTPAASNTAQPGQTSGEPGQ